MVLLLKVKRTYPPRGTALVSSLIENVTEIETGTPGLPPATTVVMAVITVQVTGDRPRTPPASRTSSATRVSRPLGVVCVTSPAESTLMARVSPREAAVRGLDEVEVVHHDHVGRPPHLAEPLGGYAPRPGVAAWSTSGRSR